MDYWYILYFFDWILFFGVAATVLYLLIFSTISLFYRGNRAIPSAKEQRRFIVLIPAYKKDKTVEMAVRSMLGQTYPQRLFDIVVISDHQQELTNMKLAQQPITLLTPNFQESSKIKSLQYALLNLPQYKIFDVCVILDADCVVEPEFLQQVNDAFETASTKAIQTHTIPKNRNTPAARLDAVYTEINHSIFRRGHIAIGMSAALSGTGCAFDFTWFKNNIGHIAGGTGEKELEARLLRQQLYIDYYDNIYVYDEKTTDDIELNKIRGRWAITQFHTLLTNIRFLPSAIINQQYDWADRLIQWMLIPRLILVAITIFMSITLPFIYFTLVIKWWMVAFFMGLSFSFATPNTLVDQYWDSDFLTLPLRLLRRLPVIKDIHFSNIRKPINKKQ